MTRISAEALVERLSEWGVDTVFELPGDGINGNMEGIGRHPEKIKFVLVHHEHSDPRQVVGAEVMRSSGDSLSKPADHLGSTNRGPAA